MTNPDNYCGIYDFELLPYALGDVLTWNVQTAIRCKQSGRDKVDIYICVDPRYPSSIYQRGLVTSNNCDLFFNELLGAFGTHPLLGNIHLFHSRDDMLARLREISVDDPINGDALSDYERVLTRREDADSLNEYFIKYIYSHARLNRYAEENDGIPQLLSSRGCEPDIRGLLAGPLAGKRIVVVHPRLRRLDNGLAGDHTYSRDSDFLEWFEFVRLSKTRHPDVQFIVVGRLQEKPIELLRRPNVMSLRTLGLGLGHELTLMLFADLFIGTSSGFAAMANFSKTPYFITHMNKESCNAYAIADRSERLPFASPHQFLIYQAESAHMLGDLLDRGLTIAARTRETPILRDTTLNVRNFERDRARGLYPDATTSRFFTDDAYSDQETAFLLWPRIQSSLSAAGHGDASSVAATAQRIEENFPRLSRNFPELRNLDHGKMPSQPGQLFDRMRSYLLRRIDGNILPMALRGTALHWIGRRMKDLVLGYRRR